MPTPSPVSSPHKIFAEAFRCRCIDLIGNAYKLMDQVKMHSCEEPAVTGCLVQSIKSILDSHINDWMVNFFIADNPPLNLPGKLGKSRPIVDIEFELSGGNKRPHFRVEAKWVGKSKTALGAEKGYFGKEGIKCFLSGYYPLDKNFRVAGMLAYLHSNDESYWSMKMEDYMRNNKKGLRIKMNSNDIWRKETKHELKHVFTSIHNCSAKVDQLSVTHILLYFGKQSHN